MKILRNIAAVFAGLLLVFVLSIAVDTILEKTSIMMIPFSNNSTPFIIGVILYRTVFVVAGCFLTARLSPSSPMRNALILGGIGFLLGIMGAMAMWHEGPHWYPISLLITGWPASWLGGKLAMRR